MPADAVITQSSDALAASRAACETAGRTLGSTAQALVPVPGNAFGTLGEPVAAAANAVAGEIGDLLASLSRLAETTAAGTASVKAEFERVEQDAVSLFHRLEAGLQQ